MKFKRMTKTKKACFALFFVLLSVFVGVYCWAEIFLLPFGLSLFHPVTYITEGQTPTWKTAPSDQIIYMPKPKTDSSTSNYRRKDLLKFQSLLRDVPYYPLIALTWNRLNEASKKLLIDWKYELDNPVLSLSRNKVLHHLDILLTKRDPDKKWTLECKGCFMNDFKIIIEPKQAFQRSDPIEFIILVTSVPKSIQERRSVRQTWGSMDNTNCRNKFNFQVIFMFGVGWSKEEDKILEDESSQYGDILQSDYHDSYYNLTQKVICGYRWVLQVYPQAKFIIRSAEDTFVHVDYIHLLLQQHGNHPQFQDYQLGDCYAGHVPTRWPEYKGYVSIDEYSLDLLPPFALGTTFITSMNLTRRIVEKSVDISYMPIEDNYIGLVLRQINSGCTHLWPNPSGQNEISSIAQYIKLFTIRHYFLSVLPIVLTIGTALYMLRQCLDVRRTPYFGIGYSRLKIF